MAASVDKNANAQAQTTAPSREELNQELSKVLAEIAASSKGSSLTNDEKNDLAARLASGDTYYMYGKELNYTNEENSSVDAYALIADTRSESERFSKDITGNNLLKFFSTSDNEKLAKQALGNDFAKFMNDLKIAGDTPLVHVDQNWRRTPVVSLDTSDSAAMLKELQSSPDFQKLQANHDKVRDKVTAKYHDILEKETAEKLDRSILPYGNVLSALDSNDYSRLNQNELKILKQSIQELQVAGDQPTCF